MPFSGNVVQVSSVNGKMSEAIVMENVMLKVPDAQPSIRFTNLDQNLALLATLPIPCILHVNIFLNPFKGRS